MYSLSNIVRVLKSRRWARHVALMEEKCIQVWWGKVRERDHSEDQGLDGRIILRWIFRMWDVWAWTGSIWLRIGTGGGHV